MAKKKKRKAPSNETPKAPTSVGTSLRGLIKEAVSQPKPPAVAALQEPQAPAPTARPAPERLPAESRASENLQGDDRRAFYDAMAGVRPLDRTIAGGGTRKGARAPTPVDESPSEVAARARLAALVAGGVRFDVERDGQSMRGARAGADRRVLRDLADAVPERTLDLHGQTAAKARRSLVAFLRDARQRMTQRVLVIFGKGHHSESGVGVLSDVVVEVLTESAAPWVLAFHTAPARLGGTGAVLVQLDVRC